MTSTGMHAADDGSLARSTGGAAARGAMLIGVALIIGLLLMQFALDDPPTDLSAQATVDDVTTGDDGSGEGDSAAAGDTEPAVDAVDPEGDGAEAPPATIDEGTPETIPEDVEPAPDTGVARPASEVSVLVSNGTGASGVAGAVSDKLKAQAYIAVVSNAPRTAEAVIYYRVGYDSDARAIADILGAPVSIITPAPGDGTIAVAAEAISDGRLTDANVVVILGDDNAVPTS